MSIKIYNTDDLIDSREVVARIEDLEQERQDMVEDNEDPEGLQLQTVEEWDEENGKELKDLKDLAEQCEGYGDWEYGEGLIRDDYFIQYAIDLADDVGAVDLNASWPMNCIDWEKAAEELKQDYAAVEFDGVTYWLRA